MEGLQVLLDNVGAGKSAVGTVDGCLASTSEAELRSEALNAVG